MKDSEMANSKVLDKHFDSSGDRDFILSPTIIIPVSSSVYNLTFSNYSVTSEPPLQNYYAALSFVGRLYKDRFFNEPQPNITTTISQPVIDVKTVGVWLHVENPSRDLRYSIFDDLLTYIAYFSLYWKKERTLFQLVARTDGRPVYTGWIASANESYAQQFP
ncbi:MAG: hypothetical protein Q9163_000589 [Psora crenata]